MNNKKFLYETHMHTIETSFCSKTKAKEHVRIYKDRGYTGIIITDHLSTHNFQRCRFKNLKALRTWEDKVKFLMKGYKNAKEAGDEIGLDVFLGWEFYDEGSEFLTYGLDENFLLAHKDLDKMHIEEYSKLVRDNGGYLAHAHPYRPKKDKAAPIDFRLIDGVEIYNASRTHKGNENAKAIVFAREHNLPVQAGTDAHNPNLRLYSGIMLEKRAESIFDIIDAIKNRTAEPILQPKESFLWHGDIDEARRAAQTEGVSELLVKVIYDCKHAKSVAEDLCEYLQDYPELDVVCAHMDDLGRIEKTGKRNKMIVLGHHAKTKAMLANIGLIRYQHCGMKYAFHDDLCVLTASKSILRKSKELEKQFDKDFFDRFGEDVGDLYIRGAQFKYAAMEFVQNGLLEFLNLE